MRVSVRACVHTLARASRRTHVYVLGEALHPVEPTHEHIELGLNQRYARFQQATAQLAPAEAAHQTDHVPIIRAISIAGLPGYAVWQLASSKHTTATHNGQHVPHSRQCMQSACLTTPSWLTSSLPSNENVASCRLASPVQFATIAA